MHARPLRPLTSRVDEVGGTKEVPWESMRDLSHRAAMLRPRPERAGEEDQEPWRLILRCAADQVKLCDSHRSAGRSVAAERQHLEGGRRTRIPGLQVERDL